MCSQEVLCSMFKGVGLSDAGARLAQFLVELVLILIGAFVLSRLASRFVARSVRSIAARSATRDVSARTEQRARTLGGVVASAVRIAVWTIATLLVVDSLGVNLGPLLAGASIVGVALGFGAQSLVKDFLSGFFILVEDQYGVGDTITVAGATGTVEEVNLRVTRLRSTDGTVWFVPNGEIRKVGNSAKEWGRALVDVVIAYDADAGVASTAMAEEAKALAAEDDFKDVMLEPPEVLGVESLDADGITLRVAAKTKAADRTRVARELRLRITARLRREGVVPVREPAVAGSTAKGTAPAGDRADS